MFHDIEQNIRDCGQSLIDNAAKIAGSLPKYSSRLSLTCYPDERDQCIYINVNYDFIPEEFVENFDSNRE